MVLSRCSFWAGRRVCGQQVTQAQQDLVRQPDAPLPNKVLTLSGLRGQIGARVPA